MKEDQLEKEEEILIEVFKSARDVQEFLWGDVNESVGIEEFKRMLRKRLAKIDQLDTTNPYYKIELRKRLLQTACICVNFIRQLEERDLPETTDVRSNLSDFDEKVIK